MPPCCSAMSGSSDPAFTPMRIGRPRSFASLRDELDVLGLADVARVEAQRLHAGLHRRQRELVLEVDVGDDRHRRAGHDLRQPLGRRLLVARAAHDVGSRRRRARRSARACRRRRRSWWWSSTAPTPARRRPTAHVADVRSGRVIATLACTSRLIEHPATGPMTWRDVEEHRRQPERHRMSDQQRHADRHQLAVVDLDPAALAPSTRSTRRSRSRRARRRTAAAAAG